MLWILNFMDCTPTSCQLKFLTIGASEQAVKGSTTGTYQNFKNSRTKRIELLWSEVPSQPLASPPSPLLLQDSTPQPSASFLLLVHTPRSSHCRINRPRKQFTIGSLHPLFCSLLSPHHYPSLHTGGKKKEQKQKTLTNTPEWVGMACILGGGAAWASGGGGSGACIRNRTKTAYRLPPGRFYSSFSQTW